MKLNRVSHQIDINKQFRQTIKKGNSEKVVALLKSGDIDLQAANKRGNTPIHLAAKLRKTSLLGFLLSAGSSPCAENLQGNTPMHLFMRAIVSKPKNKRIKPITKKDLDVLETLVQENHIDKQNLQGDTILHLLAKYTTDDKQEADKLCHFFSLLRPDLSIQNKKGNAPLHLSSKRLHRWTITRLIVLGANPNQLNGKQLSPFNVALKSVTEKVSNVDVSDLQLVSSLRTIKAKKSKAQAVVFKSKGPAINEKAKATVLRFYDTRDQLFFHGSSPDLNKDKLFASFQREASIARQKKLLDQRLFEESKKGFHQKAGSLQLEYISNPFDNVVSRKKEIATRLYEGAPEIYQQQQELYRQKVKELSGGEECITEVYAFKLDEIKNMSKIRLDPNYSHHGFPRKEWLSYMEALLACTDAKNKFASVASFQGMNFLEVQSSDLIFFNLLKKKMGSLSGTKLILNSSQEPELYIFILEGINGCVE